MKNITVKVKALLQTLITIACIFFTQTTNAYTTKSTTFCGDTCILHRNNNLYMVVNASLLSPAIKGTYSFREGYGRNVYFNHPFMYGIFIGTKFNDRLGLEIGYETQHTKTRINKITQGGPMPGGIIIPGDDIVLFETYARTEHFQALLNVKLNDHESKHNINWWSQIGISYSQLRARQDILYVLQNNPPHFAWNDPDGQLIRTFKCKKILPVIKLGADCNITDNLSIRGSVGWSNLRLLKAKSKERPWTHTEVRLGDEYNVSVGMVYKFF